MRPTKKQRVKNSYSKLNHKLVVLIKVTTYITIYTSMYCHIFSFKSKGTCLQSSKIIGTVVRAHMPMAVFNFVPMSPIGCPLLLNGTTGLWPSLRFLLIYEFVHIPRFFTIPWPPDTLSSSIAKILQNRRIIRQVIAYSSSTFTQ